MLSFADTLTEQKNTHMTHIEDKVLYGGVNGTRQAIFALRDLRDMLGGKKEAGVSVKWDGTPAIFAGTDPRDGQFFVATKGIFNKNPKIYKTNADIDADLSGQLADKLKGALQYLPALGIKGVIQGDFLFGPGIQRKTEMIDGKKYLIFHPNTIVYAIPYEQSAAARRAKIGVVWHTTYKGSTFETMKASYGVKVSSLKNSPDVWSQDAILRDVTNATMTKRETQDVNEILTQIGTIFNQISGSTLRELEANKALGDHIQQYNNLFIKKGQIIGNEVAHTEKLVRWIKSKYAKEASTRKTQKGKSNVRQKRDDLLTFFSLKNKVNLVDVFRLQKLIVLAKLKLINKLNRLQALDTFVKTNKGFKVTGQEGFVAIDKLGGDAVKIVDRLEFSYNNWSPNILKGWDKPN